MSHDKKESVLLEFLGRTKDGEYAPIDPFSLEYIRIKELAYREEQVYYYGLS